MFVFRDTSEEVRLCLSTAGSLNSGCVLYLKDSRHCSSPVGKQSCGAGSPSLQTSR